MKSGQNNCQKSLEEGAVPVCQVVFLFFSDCVSFIILSVLNGLDTRKQPVPVDFAACDSNI